MPSELVQRIDLDRLYLPFTERMLEMLARCRARGANYYATLGTRAFAEQAKLYFQGRTTPGDKVTNAPAGLSLHQYGLAIDAVRDLDMAKAGLQPYWGEDGYDILREEAEKVGLQAGLVRRNGERWDYGHVQVPLAVLLGRSERAILLEFKAKYLAAVNEDVALRAIWDELDRTIVWA